MYYSRDKLISLRISSNLYEKFQKLVKENTEIHSYAGKNHHRYYGKTLKKDDRCTCTDKYSLADVLEEALELLFEKNEKKE